ncbi:MAG TPA: TonB family protein [Prosthecobacter sp.]|jgi:TonB family protein|nr:TonB family protein [Prosthecobacter sp.]
MNSSVIHTLPPMGLDRAISSAKPAAAVSSGARRRRSSARSWVALCWIVGITGSFLTTGIIGIFAADVPPIHLISLEDDVAADQTMIETSMAELQALEASEEEPAETEPLLPVEIPETVETPPETLDLPEVAEAMTLEDVFAVPTAPKIEDALRPVDPVVKPRPAPTPPRPRTQTVARSSGAPSTTSQSGTADGTGTSGTGRGKFPSPPYPTFARSAGMQGTVRLSISVGPSGAVEGVTVMGSTGFSALDEYAASWVRRNWRWPGGSSNRYTLPLTFRLR